jgi:hypothetical protein
MWVRSPSTTPDTWANALASAKGLTLCGFSDWRLPNRKELFSLINHGLANSAATLNTQGFSNVQANSYWSSSTFADNLPLAWVVDMNAGGVGAADKPTTRYVWPVRAGQ